MQLLIDRSSGHVCMVIQQSEMSVYITIDKTILKWQMVNALCGGVDCFL